MTSRRPPFISLMVSVLNASSDNEDENDELVDIFTSTERRESVQSHVEKKCILIYCGNVGASLSFTEGRCKILNISF